jgi:hypothetical protein
MSKVCATAALTALSALVSIGCSNLAPLEEPAVAPGAVHAPTANSLDPCPDGEPCRDTAKATANSLDPCPDGEPCRDTAKMTANSLDPCPDGEPCRDTLQGTANSLDPCPDGEPCRDTLRAAPNSLDPCAGSAAPDCFKSVPAPSRMVH